MTDNQLVSDSLPAPAATVILLRDAPAGPEALMVRRHEGTVFMAGAYVFPGGRVDPGDREADETWCSGLEIARSRFDDLAADEAVAYHVAAARELFEEAGVLLAQDARQAPVSLGGPDARARFSRYRIEVHGGSRAMRAMLQHEGLRLILDTLLPFAHWVTPPIDVRRFDTRFFIARLPPDQIPAHDNTETTDSVWITAAEAIARCGRDEIILPVPTWTTLRELERFTSVDAIVAWARTRRIARREPRVIDRGGDRMLLLPGDPLNPDPWNEWMPPETRFVRVHDRWRARTAGT